MAHVRHILAAAFTGGPVTVVLANGTALSGLVVGSESGHGQDPRTWLQLRLDIGATGPVVVNALDILTIVQR
ncbi:MAG TPA: hypothetical protein VHC86_10725 [Opitutaceae bacterium]|nr:hypothetical protein [Opitutaceae bacterium]